MSYLRTARGLGRDVRLYLLVWILIGFSYFGLYLVLLNLFLLRLGYGAGFAGLLAACGQVAFAASSLPAAALGGRLGYRRAMSLGVGLIALGFGLLPFGEWLPAGTRDAWLIATYALAFIGGPLFIVNGNPYLTAITQPEQRMHAFALREGLIPLAAVGGSLTAGLLPARLAAIAGVNLANPLPYRYPLWLAAILILPGLGALMLMADADTAPKVLSTSGHKQRRDPPLRLIGVLALVVLLFTTGPEAVRSLINVYLDRQLQMSASLIGGVLAAGQLAAVLAALTTPVMVARWDRKRTLLLGGGGAGLSLLLLASVPSRVVAAFSFVGMMLSAALLLPTLAVFEMEAVAVQWRGAMSAVSTMAQGLGASGLEFGSGYLITAAGYPAFFGVGAALVFGGSALYWIGLRTPRGPFGRLLLATHPEDEVRP